MNATPELLPDTLPELLPPGVTPELLPPMPELLPLCPLPELPPDSPIPELLPETPPPDPELLPEPRAWLVPPQSMLTAAQSANSAEAAARPRKPVRFIAAPDRAPKIERFMLRFMWRRTSCRLE